MALIADSDPEHARVPCSQAEHGMAFHQAHGLIELFVILGGICLAWLGVALGSGQL